MTVDTIRSLQAAMVGPVWERIWLTITHLWSEDALMTAIPLLFWFTSRRFARTFTAAAVLSIWLNEWLKSLFDTPRPSGPDIRIMGQDTGTGSAFPSGHAQGSAVIWLVVASALRRRWFTVLAVVMALLVGVSRLYLGLHHPVDVLAGWGIGVLLAALLVGLAPWAERELWRGSLLVRLGGAVVPPLTLVSIFRSPVSGSTDVFAGCGAWLGLLVGSVLEEQYLKYSPRAPWWAQILKAAAGAAVLFGLRAGLKLVFPPEPWLVFFRYALLGAVASLVLPWLFVVLGLSTRSGHGANQPPIALSR